MVSRRKFLSYAALTLIGTTAPATLSGCIQALGKGDDAAVATPGADEPVSLVTFLYDTVIEITAYCPQALLDRVEQRLTYFENIFSKTVAGSDIFLINEAAGAPVTVHPETTDIITRAIRYSELSDGIFDITIGGVVDLWDFKNGIIPDEHELALALEHVDYRMIALDGDTVTLADPATMLDLGGIAKGYITDDIVNLLRKGGCENALVNLGGNTFALGSRPNGDPWHVGLQDPGNVRGTVFGSVAVTDKSVIASGINERSFERDGVRYHHLLDPATGMPCRTDVASSTIVSDLSTDGDAFSTITFLWGPDKSSAVIEAYGGLEVLWIDTDGVAHATAGMRYEKQ